MKRYMVFAGLTYEPNGGALDYKSDHATLTQAKIMAEVECDTASASKREKRWAHVFDTHTGKIVFEFALPVKRTGQ